MEFDLIFIIGYFRTALPIISVIKHIKDKKIGFIYAENDKLINLKVKNYTDKFKDLLIEEKAILCDEDQKYKTKILIIQENIYTDIFLKKISKNLNYKYAIGLLGFRLGFKGNSDFLNYFNIDVCTINDIELFNLLVKSRNCIDTFKRYKILEIGLPYLEYPPFQTPKIDWLIASPTTFCFLDIKDLNAYLNNVLILMNQINKNELIVYKPHNGNEKDYLNRFSFLTLFIPPNIKIYRLLNLFNQFLPKKFQKFIFILSTALLQKIILKRTKPLSELSDKYYLSVEAFIPNVTKGVIGGNSNTIWGTRFYKKKYLNCINNKNKSLYFSKRADKTLYLNLSYFGVPFCENDINFVIENEIRNKDLIRLNIVDLIKEKLRDYD